MKFYICNHCGNIVSYFENSGVPVMCCGEKMVEIIPNTNDAVMEKHVPVMKREGNKVIVEVGSVLHPMEENHYIKWIILETQNGFQKKNLNPGDLPKVEFLLSDDDKIINIFSYCNLHGLWKY